MTIGVIAIHFYIIDREFHTGGHFYTGYFLNYIEAQDFMKDNRKAGNTIWAGYAERVEVEKDFFF